MTMARIKLSTYLFLSLSLFCLNAFSNDSKAEEKKPQKSHHKEVMNRALDSFVRFLPFLSSEASYSSDANTKKIKQELESLERVFTDARKETLLQQDLFATTNIVILDNLKLAKDSLNYSNRNFSYLRMKETINLCFHCHAQLPSEFTSSFSNGFNNLSRKKFSSDFDYAQYLFLVRNFEAAKTNYFSVIDNVSKVLAQAPKRNVKISIHDQQQLEESLRQVLVIYTKIQRDIKGAISFFSKMSVTGFPTYLKQQIAHWTLGLKEWEAKNEELSELKNNKEMTKFVNSTLAPILSKTKDGAVRTIDLLVGTGLLSNYIFVNSTDPDRALALYYLGLSENVLSSTSFYSLAESYFRDCVIRYPQHEIAKKCYDEYESNIIFGFTGSSGVRIPADVQKDLDNLKKLLNDGNKKK
jgi:hypothetical protein